MPYGDLLVKQALEAFLPDVTVRTRWLPDYVDHLPHIVITGSQGGNVADFRGRYTHACDLEVFTGDDKNATVRLANAAIVALNKANTTQRVFDEGTITGVAVDVMPFVLPTVGVANEVIRVNATVSVGIRPAL